MPPGWRRRHRSVARRSWAGIPRTRFWSATTDPDRALANLLRRDRIFTDAVAAEATDAGLAVLRVDGTHTPEELAADLAGRFGLLR